METLRTLRDEGLRCPHCGYERMAASDSFCWRCARALPEGWHAR